LVVPRRFEPGAGLAVELPASDGQASYTVLAKVIRACSLAGGSWMLGCKFISELSDDEVQRLLPAVETADSSSESQTPDVSDPIAPSRLADAAPAFPEDATARQVLRDVHFQLETRPGVRLNCLIKHLEVPENWPLTPGKHLTMWGRAGNGPLALFKVVVVRCGEQGQHWTVQCRILELITADQMQALAHLVAHK
jgi:hypothetical protein